MTPDDKRDAAAEAAAKECGLTPNTDQFWAVVTGYQLGHDAVVKERNQLLGLFRETIQDRINSDERHMRPFDQDLGDMLARIDAALGKSTEPEGT